MCKMHWRCLRSLDDRPIPLHHRYTYAIVRHLLMSASRRFICVYISCLALGLVLWAV